MKYKINQMKNRTPITVLLCLFSVTFYQGQSLNIDSTKTKNIKEVILIGSKKTKLIEQKVDRMIFNVSNSIASQGMSGLDVLSKTPFVKVDADKGLSIVGKNTVNVMINGRMLNLSGNELTNYMQSLRSEDIAKIEVITTPPAKYEAQGNSGLINIITKKNTKIGWSGNLNTSYARNSSNNFRNGLTLNYNNRKINSTIKLSQYDNGYSQKGNSSMISPDHTMVNNLNALVNSSGIGLNYTLDYEINEKSNIGIVYDYGRSKYKLDSHDSSEYFTGKVLDSILNTYSRSNWTTPANTLSAYYDLKLDTLGKKMSITANLFNSKPDKINHFTTSNLTNLNENIVRNTSLLKYSVYSGQADFTLPYSWGTLEAGAKYTFFQNRSDVGYYNFVNSQYIIDPNNSNLFDYNEQNYGSYLNFERKINEKWFVKAGLRYEYTNLKGSSNNDINEPEVKNTYGKLFPSIYLMYNPNKNHSLSIKYSKRINRPDFSSLNPFRWYTNPYIYSSGNSTLQPSFNDNVELGYTFRNKLTISVYNDYTRNDYTQISRLSEGVYSSIMENSFNVNNLGVKISYYDTFFKIWEFSTNVSAYKTKTNPTTLELKPTAINSLYYSFDNTIALNPSKTVFIMLNFWHRLPFVYSNVYLRDMLEFSPGIKASLFNKQLQISAVFSDAFRTIKNNGYVDYSNLRRNFSQYNDYRKFTLSLTYNFGNNKVKSKTKNINFEEKDRTN